MSIEIGLTSVTVVLISAAVELFMICFYLVCYSFQTIWSSSYSIYFLWILCLYDIILFCFLFPFLFFFFYFLTLIFWLLFKEFSLNYNIIFTYYLTHINFPLFFFFCELLFFYLFNYLICLNGISYINHLFFNTVKTFYINPGFNIKIKL